MNVTGGGRITSSNSYTGATTISATPGWFGANTFFVDNADALGAASGDLTISGGTVGLQSNTITRSGNVTITGGTVHTGTISKSGSNYDIQGGNVNAVLAGTAGLTKSGGRVANLNHTNTYSGGTIINGGTLGVTTAGGLGDASGTITVNNVGTDPTQSGIYISAGLTISRTGDVTVNGGNLTTDNSNMGTLSVSGGNFFANNAAVLAVRLAGTAGLTVGGAGETYLWTGSSYTGATVISSGQLILGGVGAISEQSTLQIASGAAVNLTGAFAANNINRTFAGLTGAGILYGEGGTVTVNKASDTDIFSGDIQGAQGLIKSGAGTLALGGASSYTGTTMVNEGRLVVAHADALGATSGGTIVASGAQLRINSLADTVFPAEPLILSGQGLPSGGALRNATNNNIWQGAIALAANATIGAASGTTLTLAAASGATLNLGAYDLVVDGAGTVQVNGGITGSGQISKTGSGQLVISNSVLVATIQSNSVSLDFATPPADGPYAVLSGPLDSASLATTPSVTGLPGGATATLTNNPNLIVIVSSGAPTNQKPVVDSGLGFSISENPAIGTPVGSLTATDADSDPLSGWTIVSGNEDGAFALDSTTGELTVAGILDHETAASYTLEVSVSDGKEASDSAMVSVSVVNVPEFADVFGSADPAADANGDGISNLMAYALGASASNATVSRPVTTVNSSNLTITALVRTNDSAVQVRGSATTNLASWTNAPIVGTPASDQTGAVSGVTQKQEFTVERGTDPKKFLRLKATLQP